MPPLTLLDHLLNFAAPAFCMALALALLTRWSFRRDAAAHGFWVQVALNSVAGVAVLAVGLWHFGRDGKMATYLAMVLVCGTVQWLSARAYRR
ncbi:MAG: hypothetical protein EOP79_07890 [Variovorax sp.]|nr:MAG: hypothetical protein EOP79_07890 [Variovorax sp.]